MYKKHLKFVCIFQTLFKNTKIKFKNVCKSDALQKEMCYTKI